MPLLKHSFLGIMVASLLVIAGLGAEAHAADISHGALVGGKVCPGDGGVTLRLVTCIKGAVIRAADTYLVKVYEFLGTYIAAFTTMAVIVFGILLAVGAVSQPKSQSFILILKIGFISYFAANFGQYYHKFLGIMDQLIGIVTTAAATSHTLTCDLSASGGNQVWGMFDCAFMKLLGAGKQIATNKGIGLAALIMTVVFSAKEGFYMFLMLLGIVATFIVAVARSLYIFVSAYVVVALLSALAPLMLPFAFFQHTRDKFEAWARMILGYILQPIFLVAFLTMTLSALDVVMFTGEDSVYRTIAGDDALQPNFNLDKYLHDHNYYRKDALLELLVLTDPWKLEGKKPEVKDTGWFGRTAQWAKEKIKLAAVKGASLIIGLKVENVDLKKLADARGISPPQELVYRILITLAVGIMMGFVFISLLNYIPELAQELTGGRFSTPSSLSFGPMLGERAYQRTTNAIMQTVNNMGKKKK